MTQPDIDGALEEGARRLSLQLSTAHGRKYGWNRKSAGSSAINVQGQQVWLKVFGKPASSIESKLWNGELLASTVFRKVHKPRILSDYDWNDCEWDWRCLTMERIDEPVLSDKPTLAAKSTFSDKWVDSVYESLQLISSQFTERIGIRQDLVTRRIAERFGPEVPSTVGEWATAHNDLHFANLTVETAWILDWESWGLAPAGFDAAWLYCNCLANPRASKRIFERFEPLLSNSSGKLALMFSVAELQRMNKLYGEYPEIQSELDRLATELIVRRVI